MQTTLYDGQVFQRGKWWYIIFFCFFSFMIILCILTRNFEGAVLLFLILGGYILFGFSTAKKIKATISDEGLMLGERLYPWSSIGGFVLEINAKTQKLENIVLLIGNMKLIHTFADDIENTKQFLLNLSEKTTLLNDYPQTFIEKIVKKLKLG